MWKPALIAVSLSIVLWVACVALAPSTGVSLLPIFPGMLLALSAVGYHQHPSRAQDLAFGAIWLATTVVLYAPIIFGFLTAERYFGGPLPGTAPRAKDYDNPHDPQRGTSCEARSDLS
jgi:hypothetical protein